jgi:outer membrane protein assembly factor BamB
VGEDSFTCQIWNDHPGQNDQSRACLLRINDGQPELVWENDDLAVQISNYTVWEGYIYAMDTSMAENDRRKRQKLGQLQCLDLETGELIWHTDDFYDPAIDRKFNREDADNAPTWLIVDGKIIIWDRVQIIIGEVSPEGYKRLSAFRLEEGRPGKSWTAMAFSDGRLFVRSGGELYGIDLRGDRTER